jgi:hypothetical protein
MKISYQRLFPAILLATGALCLIEPFVDRVVGLTSNSCVSPEPCCPMPPPGKVCSINDPVDGSQTSGGTVAATASFCAYVYNGSNPGWPCGGAVADQTGAACH